VGVLSAAEVSLRQEAPPALVPRAMHKMRSLHDRLANDDHFSNDRRTIHDPAFHDRLNDTVDHRSFDDRLNDFSFDNAALDDRTNDMALDDPTLYVRHFILIINLDVATTGSTVEHIIVGERIASPELCGGRGGCRYSAGRIGECGNSTYSEDLHKST
jgi:hypothetical protein